MPILKQLIDLAEENGYGLALVRPQKASQPDIVIEPYIQQLGLPNETKISDVKDFAEIQSGEFKGCYLTLHSGCLETEPETFGFIKEA